MNIPDFHKETQQLLVNLSISASCIDMATLERAMHKGYDLALAQTLEIVSKADKEITNNRLQSNKPK